VLRSWSREVDTQRKEFVKQAGQVSDWDSQLRTAQVALLTLSSEQAELLDAQRRLDTTLEAVEKHQKRMGDMLTRAEDCLDALLPKDAKDASGAPVPHYYTAPGPAARLNAYETAIQIDGILNALESGIRDVETKLAEAQGRDDKDQVRDDPPLARCCGLPQTLTPPPTPPPHPGCSSRRSGRSWQRSLPCFRTWRSERSSSRSRLTR